MAHSFSFSRTFALILLPMLVVAAGCKGRVGDPLPESERQVRADSFMSELDSQFNGQYTFKFMKFGQDDGNFAIIQYTETSTGTVRVMAADLAEYTPGTDYFSYAATRRFYFRLADQGDGTYKCKISTCIGYDRSPKSSSLVFEATESTPRDLEKAGALIEQLNLVQMSENLSAQFGLSEERSLVVAKLATQWNKISKTRAMTPADTAVLAKSALGSSLGEFEEAYMSAIQGNAANYDALVKKAADLNEISPEQFNEIVGKLTN